MISKKSDNTYLGIDPGLADTGWGVISKNNNVLKVVGYGSVVTSKKTELADRLVIIEKEIKKIIKKYQPDLSAIEKLFFHRNITTAMTVGQARGVVMLTLRKQKLPITELTPLQVKQAVTGYGRADKKQIQEMVKMILKMDKIPKPDDAADALAITICLASFKNFSKMK